METVIQKLLEYGIAGCFIIYLAWTNHRLSQTNDRLTDRIHQLHETRALESQRRTEATLASIEALDKFREFIEQRTKIQ